MHVARVHARMRMVPTLNYVDSRSCTLGVFVNYVDAFFFDSDPKGPPTTRSFATVPNSRNATDLCATRCATSTF